ncbi:DDB1- and CUL4-associated factor 10 homolog [Musca vetustissima]|uniref:DDB1- and CUL4-associated factor 10 homolog n=1 Tax=Musca vetustissima TaxID=27455 RepID=UPI002AB6DF99|nr:DDB1- and CUL4-associated factor 10 homolog [Musca vetustissima]
MSLHRWLYRREYGLRSMRGDFDNVMNLVYGSLTDFEHWNDKPNQTSDYGAVFNLEFSPKGNVLVAACEKKSILFFDTTTQRQTYHIKDAHSDNVNCIKFLDERMFATCSDDTTVALWDLRYLKKKVRSLHGHSNWVKNIEYSHKDNLLVTSGFDGSIFTWDINSHTEQGLIYQKVFHTSGLMRCRISPDCSKLVICSTGGYLMIIHHLDLTSLHKDLNGFRPSIYRLMQMGHQYIPQAAKFDHVFSKKQKKNRVELVTDFPEENDAEVVLALQIHPLGHSILSRNISYDEKTEWSCIHDINEEPTDITEQVQEEHQSSKRKRKLVCESDDESQHSAGGGMGAGDESGDSPDDLLISINRRQRALRSRLPGRGGNSSNTNSTSSRQPQSTATAAASSTAANQTFVPDIWAAEVTVQERAIRQNRARNSNAVTGYNYVYAISSGVLPAIAASTTASNRNDSTNNRTNDSTSRRSGRSYRSDTTANSTDGGSSTSSSDSPPYLPLGRIRVRPLIIPLKRNTYTNRERKIFENPKKLMYYIQEPNKGKGFIKEPSFSADGRIVCSPYDNGVRLLGYTETSSEYPQHYQEIETIKQKPRPLCVLKELRCHDDKVLSTKFSPTEPLLATGCKSGKVVWYHPVL